MYPIKICSGGWTATRNDVVWTNNRWKRFFELDGWVNQCRNHDLTKIFVHQSMSWIETMELWSRSTPVVVSFFMIICDWLHGLTGSEQDGDKLEFRLKMIILVDKSEWRLTTIRSLAASAVQSVILIPYMLCFTIILSPIGYFILLMDRMHWFVSALWV